MPMDNIRGQRGYRIEAKFSEKVLLPANAIEADFFKGQSQEYYRFITADGQECKGRFAAAWNNEDGRYDERLDMVCQRSWAVPFASMRSMWIGRLGKVDDLWYIINLEKL